LKNSCQKILTFKIKCLPLSYQKHQTMSTYEIAEKLKVGSTFNYVGEPQTVWLVSDDVIFFKNAQGLKDNMTFHEFTCRSAQYGFITNIKY